MKNNRKDSKKIITLLAVSILIIISFSFIHKSKDNKINANSKSGSTIKTDGLKKNNSKTSDGKSETVKDKSGENQISNSNKDTKAPEKDNTAKVTKSQEGLTVFVKAANFGAIAEILIDRSNFNNSYKYYQFFLGNKPISNIESITKSETSIFPAEEAGSEVLLKLLDENNKVLKELKIKLNEKK